MPRKEKGKERWQLDKKNPSNQPKRRATCPICQEDYAVVRGHICKKKKVGE